VKYWVSERAVLRAATASMLQESWALQRLQIMAIYSATILSSLASSVVVTRSLRKSKKLLQTWAGESGD
jgi:hypothetical protein